MTWWFIVGVWVLFVLICIVTAEWNVSIVKKRIKNGNPNQIEHGLWFAGYCALCAAIFYISLNWIEVISLLCLRASVFPVSYNLFDGLPPFNLSKSSKSIFDRTQVNLKLKSSEEVNIIAFCISIVLMAYQIITHG